MYIYVYIYIYMTYHTTPYHINYTIVKHHGWACMPSFACVLHLCTCICMEYVMGPCMAIGSDARGSM